jgi:cobaltochelatase CobN
VDNASVVASEDALRQDYRVRLFNRKWIEGMKKEGYAGADQISVMVSNTYGWKIMREKSVSDDIWKEIKSIYIDDSLNLSLKQWFETESPFAYQEILETMLEVIRKGYWNADPRTVKQIAELYADSVARHGAGGGLLGGDNTKLDKFIDSILRVDVEPGKGKKSISLPY